jgi:CBS domain containing-hemolysin-like protein
LAGVATWEWLLALAFLLGSALFAGSETALTALGEARARQLVESGGRRARMLGLWVKSPERILSTLLVGNTLVNIGAGALAHANPHLQTGTLLALATGITTAVILFFGEIIPKTVAKRFPIRMSLLFIPFVRITTAILWPISWALVRLTHAVLSVFGGGKARTPAVTSEEIEYLIDLGAREGVLDEVKEELLSSVLEFADRVTKEIMIPRTAIVALPRSASPEALLKAVADNPYARMPVYEGSIDNVVGVLIVRDLVQELKNGPLLKLEVARYMKPPFFVPEQMKISRLLKEMQKKRTHLAIVVDEFGGTSGIVTLEDCLEEIVGDIQDEGDNEAAPIKVVGEGVFLADAAMSLRDLEAFLNEQQPDGAEEITFPEEGDYETLGGFVTATAGRVPAVGARVLWKDLCFVVRAGDERKLTKVEIGRPDPTKAAPKEPAERAAG